MTSTSLTPTRITAATRRARAIHLCSAGYDFATIAAEVGYRSIKDVKAAIQSGLQEMQFEAVDEYRAVELNRLDRITSRLWTIIEPYLSDGSNPSDHPVDRRTMEAMALYLKVSERRAKYTGMETTHLEITNNGESVQKVQIQIVQDVEKFQKFIDERVLDMQEHPRMIAAERIDSELDDEDGHNNDFSLAELRSRDGSNNGRSDGRQSANGHSSGVVAGNWSDSRGSEGGGRAVADPAILSPDSEREAG